MTALGVSAPLELEDALVREATRHGHRVVLRTSSAEELVERLTSSGGLGPGAEVVVVAAEERYLSRALVEACDRAALRIVALADTRAAGARANALGVPHVPWSAGFAALEAALAPLADEARIDGPGERQPGRVVVVWGPAGAPGRTTAAIALAAEAAFLGARVALVDADTTAASVAPQLGLLDEAPGFAAAARLARAGSLTVEELERIAQPVGTLGGVVRVLTGLGRSSRWPELGGDRVASVLERAREWVDLTIVDVAASLERDEAISSDLFAPRRHGATLAALEACDEVVAIARGDSVGIARFVRALPDLRDVVGERRIRIVVNMVRASALGVAPEHAVAETLRRLARVAPEACWPFDQRAADAAVLEGAPLIDVAGRSRLRRRVEAFARGLVPAAPESATLNRQGRLTRLAR